MGTGWAGLGLFELCVRSALSIMGVVPSALVGVDHLGL